MSLSFTEEYLPSLAELSDAAIATAREKVVQELQPVLPDVDLTPGTPTGDMVVGPLAYYRAAAEEANSRLMSDMDLSNVADGLIYSCDFVAAYLGNFGVYDVENLKGTGLVRLTYTSANARTIPKTVRFRFGTDDDWSLRMVNPENTEITILQPGSSHPGTEDTYILAQTSATTWAVDVPLEGVLSAPIPAGAVGTSTEVPTELVGIVAAIEFMSGLPSASLKSLAQMARKAAFSLTAGSRASTKSLIYRNWPESQMVSPIVPGDTEMQRVAAGSAMALQAPAIDLYYRSGRDMQRETQNVRLEYVLPAGATKKVFRGHLPLLHRASKIVSLEWSGTSTASRILSSTVFSHSTRSDLYGSLHCGTRYEELYVEVDPEVDGFDVPTIPLLDDTVNGGQYAIFTVIYDADPLLETVSSLAESPDYRPAGVDVLVKSGPLLQIDDLEVTYSKKEGVRTTLSVARDKIVDYVKGTGFPDPFRETEIYDIMRNAGAERVLAVDIVGRIFVSAAENLFRSTVTDPGGTDLTADWSIGTNSDIMEVIPIAQTDQVTAPNFIINGEISPGGPQDAWAATRRTVRPSVYADDVRFTESQ